MNEQRFFELKTTLENVSRETSEPLPESMERTPEKGRLFSEKQYQNILADLEHYEQILRQWQRRINLVANASLSDLWHRHIIDSVQLFPLMQRLAPMAQYGLDVGSGGGFPALVLAVLLKHKGTGQISLIESNGKKASFLRKVAVELHLPVHIFNQRIEASYNTILAPPDIITARALADLPTLLALIAPFWREQTCALLQKGRDFSQEIVRARQDWHFDLLQYPSLTDPDAGILMIRHLCRIKEP